MPDHPLSVLLPLFYSRACRDVFTYRYIAMNLKSAAAGGPRCTCSLHVICSYKQATPLCERLSGSLHLSLSSSRPSHALKLLSQWFGSGAPCSQSGLAGDSGRSLVSHGDPRMTQMSREEAPGIAD